MPPPPPPPSPSHHRVSKPSRGTPITIIITNVGSTIHLIVLLIIFLPSLHSSTSIMSQACFFAKQNRQNTHWYRRIHNQPFINKRQKVHLPDCTETQPTRVTDPTNHPSTQPTDQSFDQSKISKKGRKKKRNQKNLVSISQNTQNKKKTVETKNALNTKSKQKEASAGRKRTNNKRCISPAGQAFP